VNKVASSVKRLVLLILFLTLSAVLLAGCAETSTDEGEGRGADSRVKVTTTIGMIADAAKEIGGESVQVTGLMGPGVDPHLYKASQGDIRKLEDADVILYSGLHLEGKMTDILEKLGEEKTVKAVTDNIPADRLRGSSDGAYDPHVWFDVELWMSAAETIRDTLIEYDPAHKADYEERAAGYLEKLEELDLYAAERIGSIPEESRVLVTAHDAFGYFGDAYGIEVIGLQGISTASEYGAKDVADLRNLLVERKIKAVFVESSVPKKSIEAVIEGARQEGHEVKIGGELFSDAMGKDGTTEGTYIGMVRHNVDTIVNALK
jgi:ABC-type metal ion transport system, periplasmic component/surface adhesin